MAGIALEQPEISSSRVRVVSEVVLAYALLECALWTRRPAQLWWGIAMLAAVVLLSAFSRRNR